MIGKDDGKEEGAVISTEHAANVMFKDLGIRQASSGACSHEFSRWMLNLFPVSMMQKSSIDATRKYYKEIKEKEAAAAAASSKV